MYVLAVLTAILSACTHRNNLDNPAPQISTTGPEVEITFQNGQHASIMLGKNQPALKKQFLGWVQQGVYRNAPVYRQVPGDFLLTGKPRLAGWGFIKGLYVENVAKQHSAHYGQVGLVVHADGTVGPELIIKYGFSVQSCCLDPANVEIGKITSGSASLAKVPLGDNTLGIAIRQ